MPPPCSVADSVDARRPLPAFGTARKCGVRIAWAAADDTDPTWWWRSGGNAATEVACCAWWLVPGASNGAAATDPVSSTTGVAMIAGVVVVSTLKRWAAHPSSFELAGSGSSSSSGSMRQPAATSSSSVVAGWSSSANIPVIHTNRDDVRNGASSASAASAGSVPDASASKGILCGRNEAIVSGLVCDVSWQGREMPGGGARASTPTLSRFCAPQDCHWSHNHTQSRLPCAICIVCKPGHRPLCLSDSIRRSAGQGRHTYRWVTPATRPGHAHRHAHGTHRHSHTNK